MTRHTHILVTWRAFWRLFCCLSLQWAYTFSSFSPACFLHCCHRASCSSFSCKSLFLQRETGLLSVLFHLPFSKETGRTYLRTHEEGYMLQAYMPWRIRCLFLPSICCQHTHTTVYMLPLEEKQQAYNTGLLLLSCWAPCHMLHIVHIIYSQEGHTCHTHTAETWNSHRRRRKAFPSFFLSLH